VELDTKKSVKKMEPLKTKNDNDDFQTEVETGV
jgi:hypothetical protein